MPLLSAFLVLGLVGSATAGNNFTGGGDGSSWDDPANWAVGLVPFDTTTHPASTTPQWYNDVTWTTDGTTCVIDEGTAAACRCTARAHRLRAQPGGRGTRHGARHRGRGTLHGHGLNSTRSGEHG